MSWKLRWSTTSLMLGERGVHRPPMPPHHHEPLVDEIGVGRLSLRPTRCGRPNPLGRREELSGTKHHAGRHEGGGFDSVLPLEHQTTPRGGRRPRIREGYPDFTSWDSKGKYYDEKSTPEQPLFMVDIEPVMELPMVSLHDMKENPKLTECPCFKGNVFGSKRLSRALR